MFCSLHTLDRNCARPCGFAPLLVPINAATGLDRRITTTTVALEVVAELAGLNDKVLALTERHVGNRLALPGGQGLAFHGVEIGLEVRQNAFDRPFIDTKPVSVTFAEHFLQEVPASPLEYSAAKHCSPRELQCGEQANGNLFSGPFAPCVEPPASDKSMSLLERQDLRGRR